MVRYIINASALRKLEEELFQPDTGRKAGLSFKLIDINQAIAEIAGCLRGNQQFLKAIDALQIASAIHVGGSPGNEFPGSSTEVPLGLHGQSEALRGLQYFSLTFQCQAFLFRAVFLPQLPTSISQLPAASSSPTPNFDLRTSISELRGFSPVRQAIVGHKGNRRRLIQSRSELHLAWL